MFCVRRRFIYLVCKLFYVKIYSVVYYLRGVLVEILDFVLILLYSFNFELLNIVLFINVFYIIIFLGIEIWYSWNWDNKGLIVIIDDCI